MTSVCGKSIYDKQFTNIHKLFYCKDASSIKKEKDEDQLLEDSPVENIDARPENFKPIFLVDID